jgi:hypothetical protein
MTSSYIAAIFWLKTRAGWKETNIHQTNGLPTKIEINWVDSQL